jgi:hypothetical protein
VYLRQAEQNGEAKQSRGGMRAGEAEAEGEAEGGGGGGGREAGDGGGDLLRRVGVAAKVGCYSGLWSTAGASRSGDGGGEWMARTGLRRSFSLASSLSILHMLFWC